MFPILKLCRLGTAEMMHLIGSFGHIKIGEHQALALVPVCFSLFTLIEVRHYNERQKNGSYVDGMVNHKIVLISPVFVTKTTVRQKAFAYRPRLNEGTPPD